MLALRYILLLFLPLYAFWFTINPPEAQTVQASIYAPRLWLIMALVLFAGLYRLGIDSGKKTIMQYLKESNFKMSTLKILILTYTFWIIVSASSSSMPIVAWIGHPVSQFGSLILLSCILLSLLYGSVELDSECIIKITCITIVPMLLISLCEAVGFRPLERWIHSPRMVYPASLVGLRQHLAGWFVIFSLLPIYFYRKLRKDRWFWISIVSGFLGVAICTNTAASIGLLFGLIYLLNVDFRTSHWKIPTLLIAIFISMVYTMPVVLDRISDTLGLQSSNFKDYSSTATGKTRLYLWKSAFKSTLQRPIQGWGDETFAVNFNRFLNREDLSNLYRLELSLEKDTPIVYKNFNTYYVDKLGKEHFFSFNYITPHGLFFNEMYSRGFIGFILLILIIFELTKRIGKRNKYAIIALIPYFIYLNFTFYVVPVTPIFFIFLGIIYRKTAQENMNNIMIGSGILSSCPSPPSKNGTPSLSSSQEATSRC